MSDCVSPYDCARTWRVIQRESPTCLRCPVSATECDDRSPACPFPSASRQKRRYHCGDVAELAKADAARAAAKAARTIGFFRAMAAKHSRRKE